MSLGAWCEFAWADLTEKSPMMANPSEFHTTLYELFFNGNAPVARETADGKQGKAALIPKKAFDDLDALMAQAAKAKAEAAGE